MTRDNTPYTKAESDAFDAAAVEAVRQAQNIPSAPEATK